MGIGFTFTSEQCPEEKGFAQINELCRQKGASFRRGSGWALASLCRTGDIVFTTQNGCLQGDCQTNIAGAGFHKAAVEFIDELSANLEIAITLDDETNYAENRNFEDMRSRHFYTWLETLVSILPEHIDDNLCLCWDLNQYQPADLPGSVVTPMGRFNIRKLISRVEKQGIAAFARDFFIWNEIEKDAHFYLNTAIAMLWEDCYFMPSRRDEVDAGVNVNIIKNLEKSLSKDENIPFPVDEYRLLCWLDAREPLDVSHTTPYKADYLIGYRRNNIQERVGNLKFNIEGSYIYEYDEDGHVYYDAMEENWHIIRASAFTIAENEEADFMDELFNHAQEPPEHFFISEEAQCMAAYVGKNNSEFNQCHQTIAQVISARQITLFTLSYSNSQEKDWAIAFLKAIKVEPEKEEKEEQLLEY